PDRVEALLAVAGRVPHDRLPLGLLGGHRHARGRHERQGDEQDRAAAHGHQMWMACPSAARVASSAASDSVGCAWIVWMSSSRVASSVRPTANSWISSVASGPTMCTPRISPVRLSATTLRKPSVSPSATALPLAVNGNFPTLTSRPLPLAAASVTPIEATCGRQYVQEGTLP